MSQKIYIVEDDASIRELESYALKSAGFETLGFENSRDFFAQMESHLPDVILLDIVMPGMDGFEVARLVRRRRGRDATPIIVRPSADIVFLRLKFWLAAAVSAWPSGRVAPIAA